MSSLSALQLNFNNPIDSISLGALPETVKKEFCKRYEDCVKICAEINKATETGSLAKCQIISLREQLEFGSEKLQSLFFSATNAVPVISKCSAPSKSRIELLGEQKDGLNAFLAALKADGTSAKTLQNLIYQIPSDCRGKLLYYIWKLLGADKEMDTTTPLFKILTDVSLRKSFTQAFLDNDSKNIIEQLVRDTEIQIADERDNERLHLQQLCLLKQKMETGVDNDELLTLLKALPITLQNNMHGQVYELSSDKLPNVYEWGKNALEKDVRLLLNLKKDSSSLIEFYIGQVKHDL